MSITCPDFIAGLGGDLCKIQNLYCERPIDSAALDGEPLNAISNGAFLVAAWGAWQLLKTSPQAEPKGLIRLLVALLAIVGLGSLLFHTVGTGWAEWGDVYPILAFLVLDLWLVLTYLVELPIIPRVLALAAVLVPAYVAESWSRAHEHEPDLIVRSLWSGALYAPIVVALAIIGFALLSRRPRAGDALFAAAALWVVSISVRTVDLELCPTVPTGTHFVWHLINAIVLFLFVRVIILYSGSGSRAAA